MKNVTYLIYRINVDDCEAQPENVCVCEDNEHAQTIAKEFNEFVLGIEDKVPEEFKTCSDEIDFARYDKYLEEVAMELNRWLEKRGLKEFVLKEFVHWNPTYETVRFYVEEVRVIKKAGE